MIPHLIDGEDAIADHFSLRGDKVWEDKTRTVTQHQTVTHVERLDSEREREGERKREREREKEREKWGMHFY